MIQWVASVCPLRLRGGRWRSSLLVAVLLALGLTCSRRVGAQEAPDEAFRILERCTAAHWGQGCYVWVLHYPEALIEPWVEAEAARRGMTEVQKEAYRSAFVADLRLDSSEAFLVSVYSFGAAPVSLTPVPDNVALLTSSGERLRPVCYDSALDAPASGVVQGLVFFPKQADDDLALAIRGLGGGAERVFAFSPLEVSEPEAPEAPAAPEVVVVDLPPRGKKSVRKVTPRPPSGEQPKVIKPKEPIPPSPPAAPRPIPPLLSEDSRGMADFVRSVRERGAASGDAPSSGRSGGGTPRQLNEENSYVSREQVLRQFLSLWAANRAGEMYDMLSDASRRVISRENFAKEVARAAEFRAGLKEEYRTEWIGEERAKVITDRRVLMFRSLVTRTLGIVREGMAWKVVW